MGSWNETCGLTKLPIRVGDPVALIVLYGDGKTDYVYSTTGYAPISLPIIGEYDDYGQVANIKNPEVVEMLYKYLNERIESGKLFIAGMEDGGDKEDTLKWNKEKLFKDSNDMLECIERGYLYGKEKSYTEGVEYEYYSVNFMMVHLSVLERIVKEYSKRIPYGTEYTLREAYSTLLEKDRETYIEKVHGHAIEPKEDKDTAPNPVLDRLQNLDGAELLDEIMNVLSETEDNTLSDEQRQIASEGLARVKVDMSSSFFMKWDFKDMCNKLFNDAIMGNIDATYIMKEYFENGNEVIREGMLDYIIMKYIFSRARIDWRPSCGRGSQSEEYGVCAMIFEEGQNLVLEHVERLREYAKEDGEDVDSKTGYELLNDDYISDPLRKY